MFIKINLERGTCNGKIKQPKEEEPYKAKKKVSQHRTAKILYFTLTLKNLLSKYYPFYNMLPNCFKTLNGILSNPAGIPNVPLATFSAEIDFNSTLTV